MVSVQNESIKANNQTILGYELTPHQNAIFNYLIPAICSCILYMFIIATDISVIFRHYKDEDPIWASLTIFIMYLPVLASYVVLISNWDLWPEYIGCGLANIQWFTIKTLEHLLFPIWSMWRYAERIFWSIEAITTQDEKEIEEDLEQVNEPRSIELYAFLQAYLHALPQILFQLFILMRHRTNIDQQTKDAQILCIAFNLAKLSMTTTTYQRFKAQKVAGKQYPWYKHYKTVGNEEADSVVLRRPQIPIPPKSVYENLQTESQRLSKKYNLEPPTVPERRRSSDFYLEPTQTPQNSRAGSQGPSRPTSGLIVTDFDDDGLITTRQEPVDEVDQPSTSKTPRRSSRKVDIQEGPLLRETSVLDGPQRQVYRGTLVSERSEPDFNISRVIYIKGLAEDDLAGKLVAFCWWFAFLLARILAISVFAYFFIRETIYILIAHYLVVIAFLLYDVKSDEVRRAKGMFFVFLGYVYIFCIIEFKIRFKKATLMYYGYFILVFFENIVMCAIWYQGQLDSLENDYWFRFAFILIAMCMLCSFSSMLFYFCVNKPKKVIVATTVLNK